LDAVSQVAFAASTDETRPVLTGVLFLWGKDVVTLVATDGFRLSQKKISVKASKNAFQSIIPKLVLSELVRIEGGGEISFCHEEKEKQVTFGIGDTVLSSRLLEGDYPDFAKIIPKDSNISVTVDKEELLRAVKLASVFAREGGNIIKLKLAGDLLKMSAESSVAGSQETKVDAKISGGKDFEISFNYRYLEEFIHSVKGNEIKMEFSGVDRAGLFTDTSDSSYLHLIMPVKVQG
jgi:DNA polymerase-3 subunit beta